MIMPQPASPAAFYCTFLLNKNKERISKIQHTNIRAKKGAKKGAEPRGRGEA